MIVDARPSQLRLDPRRTAVLVVDMQNDFGARGGMFDRAGIDITGIRETVAPTRRILARAREAGVPIVFLKMEHSSDLADAGPADAPHRIKHLRLRAGESVVAPDGSASRILVEGTWNTQILDELEPEPGDVVVSKRRYSGFFDTNLDEALRDRGVEQLIVTGCTTSICIESTVRDAMFRDYTCLVVEDCVAEPLGADMPRTNHEASLLNIEALLGWVASSDAVIAAFDEGALDEALDEPVRVTGADGH